MSLSQKLISFIFLCGMMIQGQAIAAPSDAIKNGHQWRAASADQRRIVTKKLVDKAVANKQFHPEIIKIVRGSTKGYNSAVNVIMKNIHRAYKDKRHINIPVTDIADAMIKILNKRYK